MESTSNSDSQTSSILVDAELESLKTEHAILIQRVWESEKRNDDLEANVTSLLSEP
jgi:hypothetical protein